MNGDTQALIIALYEKQKFIRYHKADHDSVLLY